MTDSGGNSSTNSGQPTVGIRSTAAWAQALGVVVGVIVLAGAAIALVWLSVQILHFLTGVRSDVLVAVVTVLGGVISVLVARLFEASNERQARLREKKVPVYESFLEAIVGQMLAIGKMDGGPTAEATQQVADQLTKLTPPLIIWASDDVLREWSRYRRQDLLSGDALRAVIRLERVLKAIRRDLGHRNSGLKVGDVLGTYINDVDDVIKNRPDLVK